MIANGMLISSDHDIYLSCLGIENCGFTFGAINESDEEKLIASFSDYARILKERKELPRYNRTSILNLFEEYLKKDYINRSFLYQYLGYDSINVLLNEARIILDDQILEAAAHSLCTLGGGNHFFEIHRITETFDADKIKKNDHIFMLHTDSITVGDTIYELYSDLHEMKRTGSLRERYRVGKFELYQKLYFSRLCKRIPSIRDDLTFIFSPVNEYQSIDIRSPLGRNLILAHNLSSIFGEMNRDAIIYNWAKGQKISIEKIGSHSHDNVTVELHKGHAKIVHRNGVQYIGNDKYCILPGAMGSFSYIMENSFNEEAYYSTNHGAGRMQDKHIAKDCYSEEETIEQLGNNKINLFRVGTGNLAEQNQQAFKEPKAIVEQMEKYKLAKKTAATFPIAVIKG